MSDASNGQDSASADEFDRELREITEGTASAPRFREPSAAERSKASAARARQARKEAARNARQAKRETRKQQPHGGSRGKLTGALILVVVLVAAGGLLWLRLGRSAGGSGVTQPASTGPAPSASSAEPSPSGALSPTNLFGGPPADPFAGSLAGTWADGAAGIVTPAAKPVGRFTAAQVAAAYATTRKLLIAANLDRQTLLGGRPTAFASLLTAEQRATFLAGLNKKGVNKSGYPLSTRKWVASFAPGSTELIGNVIKVHGTMSARTVAESGTVALAIEVNYIFAYAIEPPHSATDWMRLLDHQYGSFDFAPWDDPGGALEPWDHTSIGNAGIQCGATDGYIHPDYPSERSAHPSGSGPAVNPYSTATSVPGGGVVCGSTTGT
jgi:hypothetical protein